MWVKFSVILVKISGNMSQAHFAPMSKVNFICLDISYPQYTQYSDSDFSADLKPFIKSQLS